MQCCTDRAEARYAVETVLALRLQRQQRIYREGSVCTNGFVRRAVCQHTRLNFLDASQLPFEAFLVCPF
jgi:hypothetical protein